MKRKKEKGISLSDKRIDRLPIYMKREKGGKSFVMGMYFAEYLAIVMLMTSGCPTNHLGPSL